LREFCGKCESAIDLGRLIFGKMKAGDVILIVFLGGRDGLENDPFHVRRK